MVRILMPARSGKAYARDDVSLKLQMICALAESMVQHETMLYLTLHNSLTATNILKEDPILLQLAKSQIFTVK